MFRPLNGKVYLPLHNAYRDTGLLTTEFVELPDKSTVTTFAIINIPLIAQRIKTPYMACLCADGLHPVLTPGL